MAVTARRAAQFAATLVLGVAAFGCSPPPSDPPDPVSVAPQPGPSVATDQARVREAPNVILISIDSLRADHLGVYGYGQDTSPNIDAFARDAVVFKRAFTTTSWTLPSHVSLLTSLYPEAHGVDDDRKRLDEKAVLVSESLSAGGYKTLAVVSAPYLERKFGYAQGFDVYDDETVSFRSHEDSHSGVTTPKLHERIVELLTNETDPSQPFFAFFHYWDVHYDYNPPPPFDTAFHDEERGPSAEALTQKHGMQLGNDPGVLKHFVGLYDGEIAFVDHYLGKLFAELKAKGLYDEALIIVTADHGEEFLEHDLLWHRWNLYDTSLHVPLIVKLPGNEAAGRSIEAPVGIVDIAPTILARTGVEIPPHLDGRSLVPLLGDRSFGEEPFYLAELGGKIRSVRQGRWKLIVSDLPSGTTVELYDTEKDPEETTNLAALEGPRAEKLLALRRNYLDTAAERGTSMDGVRFEYDHALEEELKSLGYLE